MTPFLAKKIIIAPDVLVNHVDRESVFLDMKTEKYFGLDEVGTQMWQALTASGSVQEAYEKLLLVYEVDPQQLQSDLESFIGSLREHGLLNVIDP